MGTGVSALKVVSTARGALHGCIVGLLLATWVSGDTRLNRCRMGILLQGFWGHGGLSTNALAARVVDFLRGRCLSRKAPSLSKLSDVFMGKRLQGLV